MKNNYYVYIHVLEDNIPFYIGIGQNNRALDLKGRTERWNKAYNNKCKYAIIKDNITLENAEILEKELILKYGRKCDNTGTLVNIQEGGKCPDIEYYLKHPIYLLDLYGNIVKEYKTIKEAQDLDNYLPPIIKKCIEGRQSKHKEFQFIKQKEYTIPTNHIHISIIKKQNKTNISVQSFKKGKWYNIPIKFYNDIEDVKEDGFSVNAIKLCIKEPERKHKGLHWKVN